MMYVTERELANMLGVDQKKWETQIAPALEARGLPRKDALFDNRRCWPAVREFILKRAMCKSTSTEEGQIYDGKKIRNTGAKKAPEQGRDGAVVLDLQQARSRTGVSTENGSPPSNG